MLLHCAVLLLLSSVATSHAVHSKIEGPQLLNFNRVTIRHSDALTKRSGQMEIPIVVHRKSGDQPYTLILEANYELIAPNALEKVARNQFLKGTVKGYPDSRIRLTSVQSGSGEDMFEGHFAIGNETMYFEINTAHGLIAYSDSDVAQDAPGIEAHCGVKTSSGHSIEHHDQPLRVKQDVTMKVMDSSGKARRTCNFFGVCTVPSNPDCPVSIFADYSYFQRYGNDSLNQMLSLMNEVQGVYLDRVNVGLPIQYSNIATSRSHPLGGTSNDAAAWLTLFKSQISARSFAGFTSSIASRTCMNVLFTNQNFGGTLGIAYWSFNTAYGICASNGNNAALTTAVLGSYPLIRRTLVHALIHELGHAFGSVHDPEFYDVIGLQTDPSTCNLDTQKKVMYTSFNVDDTSLQFSPCSLETFNRKMPLVSCLVTRNMFPALIQTTLSPDGIYGGALADDQCAADSSTLPDEPTRGWANCPFRDSSNMCKLTCTSRDDIACTIFTYRNYKDGTICRFNSPRPDVCMSGACVSDTRPFVCDRTKVCCAATGEIRGKTSICKNYSPASSNMCRPSWDFCDPDHPLDNGECPVTIRPPGTPCACTDPAIFSTCTFTSVCGSGSNLGFCLPLNVTSNSTISSPETVNNQGLCSSYTCRSDQTCVVVANTPVCKDSNVPSCRHVCGSATYAYLYSNNTAWGCDCRDDCSQRGACCSNYANYCRFTFSNLVFPGSAPSAVPSPQATATGTSSMILIPITSPIIDPPAPEGPKTLPGNILSSLATEWQYAILGALGLLCLTAFGSIILLVRLHRHRCAEQTKQRSERAEANEKLESEQETCP